MSQDTLTPMITGGLFTVAKTWKQLKCPMIEQQTDSNLAKEYVKPVTLLPWLFKLYAEYIM